MIYLIGSRALLALKKHLHRVPRDWDLMMTQEEYLNCIELWGSHPEFVAEESPRYKGKYYVSFKAQDPITLKEYGVSIEVDATNNLSRKFLCEQAPREAFAVDTIDVHGVRALVPHIHTLWAFKKSHAHYDVFLRDNKTVRDLEWITQHCEPDVHKKLTVYEGLLYEFLKAEAKERDAKRASNVLKRKIPNASANELQLEQLT